MKAAVAVEVVPAVVLIRVQALAPLARRAALTQNQVVKNRQTCSYSGKKSLRNEWLIYKLGEFYSAVSKYEDRDAK